MNQKFFGLLVVALGCVVLFSKSAHAQERHGFDRVPLSVAIGVNVAGTFADLYTTNSALNRGAVEGFGAAAGSTSIGKVAAFRITTLKNRFALPTVTNGTEIRPLSSAWLTVPA